MKPQPNEFIDFAALRKHVANYDTLFQTLLQLFLDQAPLWIDELGQAFADNDPVLVRQICHKIKGGAGTLKAQRIIEAALELKKHAVDGDLANAGESLALLVAAIEGTAAAIRESGHIKT
jgi:HPt (histidine-containing phosphotransfer) domain-containing protein